MQPLRMCDLVPNRMCLHAIRDWCEQNPDSQDAVDFLAAERASDAARDDNRRLEAARASIASEAAAAEAATAAEATTVAANTALTHEELVTTLSQWLASGLGNAGFQHSSLFVAFIHDVLQLSSPTPGTTAHYVPLRGRYVGYPAAWRQILGETYDSFVTRYRAVVERIQRRPPAINPTTGYISPGDQTAFMDLGIGVFDGPDGEDGPNLFNAFTLFIQEWQAAHQPAAGAVAAAAGPPPLDGASHIPCSIRSVACLPYHPCNFHACPSSIIHCHACILRCFVDLISPSITRTASSRFIFL